MNQGVYKKDLTIDASVLKTRGVDILPKDINAAAFLWSTFSTAQFKMLFLHYHPKRNVVSKSFLGTSCVFCDGELVKDQKFARLKSNIVAHLDCFMEEPKEDTMEIATVVESTITKPVETRTFKKHSAEPSILDFTPLTEEPLPALQFEDHNTRFGHYVGIVEGREEANRDRIKALEADKVNLTQQVQKLLSIVENYLAR